MRELFNKIARFYFSKDAFPYWCILALDCLLIIVFFFVGYYMVQGAAWIVDKFWIKLLAILGCLVPYIFSFRIFHTYANVIRYSSFIDLRNVFFANTLASVIVIVLWSSVPHDVALVFPDVKVTLCCLCFATLVMWMWRVIVKTLFDITSASATAMNIFIYGTKDFAVGLAKSIRSQKNSRYIVRGFIAPDGKVSDRYIAGHKVFPDDVKLLTEMLNNNIKGVMVSPRVATAFRNNDRLISELTDAGISIFMMPEAYAWDGKEEVNHQMLKTVEIEDLLPRDAIDVDMDAIGNLLSSKIILITGAAGSIGEGLVRLIAEFKPARMILVDQAETPMHDVRRMMASAHPEILCDTIVTSITNASRMEHIFSTCHPDYVFHAAAYKHVPMMEDNPSETIQNNVRGTRVIADLAVKYGTKKFVMISTDKAVNPTNVMGCSKRICEIYCQSLNDAIHDDGSTMTQADGTKAVTQFVTTRFGNVLGSNGSVIPIFREQIRCGGPITVTHPDIVRFFMLIPEACKLVLEAGAFGKGGEIYVFDMGKPVRIADLARRMIALSGAQGIDIQYTGLRDGEKLFEEVLSDAEITIPTHHPKIRIAKVRQYSYEEACQNEERLLRVSNTYDDMEVVKVMKDIVPEYKSRHSKYEVLD